jgi:membrane dipeptidase
MDQTRRSFLADVAAAAAVGAAVRPLAASAASASPPPGLDEMFARAIIVDDLAGFLLDPKKPDQGLGEVADSGVTVLGPTLGSVVPSESYQSALSALSRLSSELAQLGNRLMLIRNFSDIAEAKRQKKIGLLVNFQNSTAIGTDLKNLDLFYGLGVRQIQITFNWRNWVGDGCTERTQAGLSYYGVDLVGRMNELGMIVDVGHSGYQTTLDAVEVSKKPIVFSHTNCKALCDHPRNKTDDQIKALARKGGVMGLTTFNWFVSDRPRSTLEDLLKHYDHAIKLVGPDHVGIGSDFELPGWLGKEPDAEWEQHRRIYAEWEWKLIKGRFPPYIDEVNNADRYRIIARGLEKRGHSTDTIEKVLGANFVRVYKEILKP